MGYPLLAVPADTQTLLTGAAIFTIAYVVLRPMLKRKRKDPLDGPAFPSLAQQRSVERQMSNLLVELSDMARQITAQLDTRAAKLEALIQEADQKLAALSRAAAQPSASSTPMPPEPPAAPATIAPDADIPPLDQRHHQVYALADQGHSPHDIARQLDRPQGEIELILALRLK